MIDALISGTLHGAPKSRTSQTGKPFVTAVVRCPMRDGGTTFANVIAFDAAARRALEALSAGDSLSIAGEATIKVYIPATGEPRPSLDLLAHAVLTEYHVSRKRKAMQSESPQRMAGERFRDDELPPWTAEAS